MRCNSCYIHGWRGRSCRCPHLVDDKGELYLLAGLKSHQPAQELLIDKMSERVTVTGTLVKHAKAQMLYIETVR